MLVGGRALSATMPIEHWHAVCDFVLTTDKKWRKSVNVTPGISPQSGRDAKERKRAMEELLLWLQHTPHLLEALCAIRRLPPATYSEEQWTTLRNVFTVLRQAVAELKVVFAEHNQVDFTELSLAAVQVLKDSPERVPGYRRQYSSSARRRIPGHFAPPA